MLLMYFDDIMNKKGEKKLFIIIILQCIHLSKIYFLGGMCLL
jgi:hypothetical protein